MATSKRAQYAAALLALPAAAWPAYLERESNLPGPRGNLELLHAAADVGSEAQFQAWLAAAPEGMPGDAPGVLPLMAALVGLGRLVAAEDASHLPLLRGYANDPRWRVREAVAMALQRIGARDEALLLAVAQEWAGGSLLERRAVVAGICEPALLETAEAVEQALALLDGITASLLPEADRRTDDLRVMRQALGYGWSVALAAAWPAGKERFEHWAACPDRDVRWLVRENLKKNRLARCAPEWAAQLLASLGAGA